VITELILIYLLPMYMLKKITLKLINIIKYIKLKNEYFRKKY